MKYNQQWLISIKFKHSFPKWSIDIHGIYKLNSRIFYLHADNSMLSRCIQIFWIIFISNYTQPNYIWFLRVKSRYSYLSSENGR